MYAFNLVGPCVTIFGSARLKPDTPEYKTAMAVGRAFGESGITVMSGGGPGLMEAASRGAVEAGGRSVACRISLSLEQSKNSYVHHSVVFRYFFVRKVMLMRNSCALIVLPGGLGTLDELFEVMTLIQTRKIEPIPIVFIGRKYWQPLFDMTEWMVSSGTITAAEMERVLSLALFTDEPDGALAHVKAKSPPLARIALSDTKSGCVRPPARDAISA